MKSNKEIVVELYLVFILGWWDRFSSYLIIIKSKLIKFSSYVINVIMCSSPMVFIRSLFVLEIKLLRLPK